MTHTTYLTQVIAKTLLLPSFVVAAAILIKGYSETGDGFSAGVIVSLAIMMQGVAFGPEQLRTLPGVKHAPKAAFLGLGISLAIVFLPVAFGEPIMTHWPKSGEHAVHFGTVEFITPVAFDVGVFLVVYGFCTGVLSAVAETQQRVLQERAIREEARRQRAQSQGNSS